MKSEAHALISDVHGSTGRNWVYMSVMWGVKSKFQMIGLAIKPDRASLNPLAAAFHNAH